LVSKSSIKNNEEMIRSNAFEFILASLHVFAEKFNWYKEEMI